MVLKNEALCWALNSLAVCPGFEYLLDKRAMDQLDEILHRLDVAAEWAIRF
jgi:hypothetical protein